MPSDHRGGVAGPLGPGAISSFACLVLGEQGGGARLMNNVSVSLVYLKEKGIYCPENFHVHQFRAA